MDITNIRLGEEGATKKTKKILHILILFFFFFFYHKRVKLLVIDLDMNLDILLMGLLRGPCTGDRN